jgi:hypothetical protein
LDLDEETDCAAYVAYRTDRPVLKMLTYL